ncbi:MAG: AAA family ATPase [Candidatus Micrarchaeota archaeon]
MDDKIVNFISNSIAENVILAQEELKKITKRRFFVSNLEKAIKESGQRVILISGLRGTGKTTALYQIMESKNNDSITYLSADALVSRGISLEDAIEALDYIQKQNIGMSKQFLLLLDEVTYLENWDLKLKVLRDRRPNIIIIATSSSALPIKKTKELARRAFELHALPFSFREYLALKYDLVIPEELTLEIRNNIKKEEDCNPQYLKVLVIMKNYNLSAIYEEYVKQDMPFSLNLSDIAYKEAITELIKRTVYEDLAKYEKFSGEMLSSAEKMIKYLSTIPSDGVKISSLSEVIGISKESVVKILDALENSVLIKGITFEGRNRMLKKPKKWFFYSSSIRYYLALPIANIAELTGNSREGSVFRHLVESEPDLFYSHEADFIAGKLKFEVGKGKKQRDGTIMLDIDKTITKTRLYLPLFALSV